MILLESPTKFERPYNYTAPVHDPRTLSLLYPSNLRSTRVENYIIFYSPNQPVLVVSSGQYLRYRYFYVRFKVPVEVVYPLVTRRGSIHFSAPKVSCLHISTPRDSRTTPFLCTLDAFTRGLSSA